MTYLIIVNISLQFCTKTCPDLQELTGEHLIMKDSDSGPRAAASRKERKVTWLQNKDDASCFAMLQGWSQCMSIKVLVTRSNLMMNLSEHG